jgi:hypothetical protein
MVLPLLLLACAPCALAQNDEEPEFKMPCQEVLKLGLNKFADVYGEKTKDLSTYGMKQALAYYVDCKRPANDRQARRLPEARRQQVDAVRDQLSKLGNAVWDIAYVEAGGGTMYGLASVSAYADREDFMATFISALAASEKPQPAARRRANQSVAKAGRLMARWPRTPKVEVYEGGPSRAEQLKLYRGFVKDAKDAVAQLQIIIGTLPDVAAERAAKRMADEIDAANEY